MVLGLEGKLMMTIWGRQKGNDMDRGARLEIRRRGLTFSGDAFGVAWGGGRGLLSGKAIQ